MIKLQFTKAKSEGMGGSLSRMIYSVIWENHVKDGGPRKRKRSTPGPILNERRKDEAGKSVDVDVFTYISGKMLHET